MPKRQEFEDSVQQWDAAHRAALDYFRDNNVFEPDKWETWQRLLAAEDGARFDVERFIEEFRAVED